MPLTPGRYRLNVVAKDTLSARLSRYEVVLDVPEFGQDKLAAGSLIVADAIERVPARKVGVATSFAIADSKVRPRIGNGFTADEKLGIYLQVYSFRPDETTQKPAGSVEYEIDNASSNEKVMNFTEDIAKMPNASASQVTIEKMLPLKTFAPGTYRLRVKATDTVANQTLLREEIFTVNRE